MIDTKIYKLDEVNLLEPAFDGEYGWLTMVELNVIDPNATRFNALDLAEFEDRTTFVLVEFH